MGLAPYGRPRYAQTVRDNLIDLKPDGSFRLNLDFFNYCTGLTMTNERFDALFERPARKPESLLDQFHMDVAASIQVVLEEVVLAMARSLVTETGQRKLCLAGGVALNCVANGKILREGIVDQLWIQPASGDAGGALGAALAAHHVHAGGTRTQIVGDSMCGALLGPSYTEEEIAARLRGAGAQFEELEPGELLARSVEALANGKVLGWFQGRMEFGPRALGARSILADPRSTEMQSALNLKIKYRESFRPFAPAILAKDASEWFELEAESPYMLLTTGLRPEHRLQETEESATLFGIEKLKVPRSAIPAVMHVDFSARVQTVDGRHNTGFHTLLAMWKERTGCPILVNTSFNVRGEPIVCTPEDAFRCFLHTEIDALAIGNCFLTKQVQNLDLRTREAGALAFD